MLSEHFVLVLLDYVARGSVFVVLFMLRWLLMLDKKFTLLEKDASHSEKLAAIEHGRRSAERREIMAHLEKHDQMLVAHAENVTRALNDIQHLLEKTK
jgi:hypothetical protein